ncbi:MAG TPA: molybdate ABC transporter substrate-binding protein [Thermoanaerobaculia bacterium]|nr:molybdate ABC transporter substrate-binding protein [Thermoanaerobaculia bacterium]
MLRLLLLLSIATNVAAAEIRVFAAASLSDALTEIAAAYEKKSGDHIVFNFASSSLLARQIELGAPADLFFSADEAKMDALQKRGLIDPRTRVSLLSNTLVIAGANITSPRDLIGRRVALAEPDSVPAGIYARTYLERIGLWRQIAPNVIPTENVRAALAALETGNVDAAIVYRTDVRSGRLQPAGGLKPAATFEIRDGPPISYPLAAVTRNPAARRFLTHLRSKTALDVFAKHGFLIR